MLCSHLARDGASSLRNAINHIFVNTDELSLKDEFCLSDRVSSSVN